MFNARARVCVCERESENAGEIVVTRTHARTHKHTREVEICVNTCILLYWIEFSCHLGKKSYTMVILQYKFITILSRYIK